MPLLILKSTGGLLSGDERKLRAQGAGRRAQGSGRRAQGAGRRAQGGGLRAEGDQKKLRETP
ncbi:MAG: hypothetical protein IPJ37_21010 [Bacteroidales bacterium]|nr:hypothetical protein [Bacteroidales bacterium]